MKRIFLVFTIIVLGFNIFAQGNYCPLEKENEKLAKQIFKEQTVKERKTDNSYSCQLSRMSDAKFKALCNKFEHNPNFQSAKQNNPNISTYTMYAENEDGDYNIFCNYPNKSKNSEIKGTKDEINNTLRDVAILIGEVGTAPFKYASDKGLFIISNPYYDNFQIHKIKQDFRFGPGITKDAAITAQKVTKTGAVVNSALEGLNAIVTVNDAVVIHCEYIEGKKSWGEASSDIVVVGAKYIIGAKVGAAVGTAVGGPVGAVAGVAAGAVVGLAIDGVYTIGKYYYNNPEAMQKLSIFDGSKVYGAAKY